MFRKKKTYQMDIKSADTTLQNIFAACNETPNTVPFDKLLLRQKAHTRNYDILLAIIALIIFITLLAPRPFLAFRETVNYSPVILEEHYVSNDRLHLVLDTGNHEIKYEEAYLVSATGTVYEIVSYDDSAHSLCFPYVPYECNIYIPYGNDLQLHLLISPTIKE